MSNKEEENHNKEMVRQHLSLLDEKSRRILELYYLEGKDMKTIAEEIGYKNADVAKKKKYEVMKKRHKKDRQYNITKQTKKKGNISTQLKDARSLASSLPVARRVRYAP